MAKISIEDVVALNKNILQKVNKGDYSLWFEHLTKSSVWVGTGEDMYFGKDNIIAHFSCLEGHVDSDILNETYYPIKLSSSTCLVVAELVLGSKNDPEHHAHALYTAIYKQTDLKTNLIYQHASFEFTNSDISMTDEIPFDLRSSDFIRNLLVNVPQKHRVPIIYGPDVFYLDTQTILYMQSNGSNTDIVCIDKTIPCTQNIQSLMKILPPTFYRIHRSYVVNTIYVTHVERFQAELISDIKIPIPPRNYMKVKKDLEKIFLEKKC